jgi:hypothetical protein
VIATERTEWNLPNHRDGEPRLTISEFKDYRRCGACYYEKHVRRSPGKLGHALFVGGFVHNAIQVGRLRIRAGKQWAIDECLEFAIPMLASGVKGYRTEIVELADGTLEWDEREPDTEPGNLDLGNFADAEAMARFCVTMTKAAVPQVLADEAQVGILAIEEYVDFDGVFPFAFSGKLDVQLANYRIRDVKTTGSYDEHKTPGTDTTIQLASYVMPWWWAGQEIPPTDAVTIAKMGKHDARIHPYQMTAEEVSAARDEIITVASMISAGYFPEGYGFYGSHDFIHATPNYKTRSA